MAIIMGACTSRSPDPRLGRRWYVPLAPRHHSSCPRYRRLSIYLLSTIFISLLSVVVIMACSTTGKTLKRANPSTIQDKFLVGYQGWFTCPGDGTPLDPHHHGWLHWLTYPLPDGGRPNTDLWPDVSEYSPSELFPVPGLKLANGDQAFVFSSRNAQTVQRHFHWMARHGVDGAFLQRFLGQCDLESGNEGIRNQRDEVGDHVRSAAEKEGRVFAIMCVRLAYLLCCTRSSRRLAGTTSPALHPIGSCMSYKRTGCTFSGRSAFSTARTT